MTLAILFLLGLLGIILCGIAAFFMYLVSRQKELSSANELLVDDAPQAADVEHVVS